MLLVLLAAALVAVSAWATAFWLGLDDRLPTDADYRAANERIAASGGADGVVVLAPDWATRGRDFLTALPVEPGWDLARDEWPGVDDVWLVALADAPRFDLAVARSTLAGRARGSDGGARIGRLWIERFRFDAPSVAFSFTRAAGDAEVVVEAVGGARKRCAWHAPTQRHRCGQGWEHVRAGTVEIGERPLACIYAHPLKGRTLAITFGDVPAGKAVRGRAGFIGQTPTEGDGAVTLAAHAGDEAIGSATFENGFHIQPFEFALPRTGLPTDVTFRVTSPDPDWRHFCFDAWVVAGSERAEGAMP